jgi:hypothetical protein
MLNAPEMMGHPSITRKDGSFHENLVVLENGRVTNECLAPQSSMTVVLVPLAPKGELDMK